MSDDATTTEGQNTAESTDAKTSEWYEGELTKVRAEAAKHRTEKRGAVEAAKAETAAEWQAKFDEQTAAFDALKGDAEKANISLVKLTAALPEEQRDQVTKFASLLQGSTEEEISAHAEEVRSLFGAAPARTRAVDPSPAGKPLALNDDDGLLAAINRALGTN